MQLFNKPLSATHLFVRTSAKLLQSCPTFYDTMDHNPPGFSVHGILRQEFWSWLLCPPPRDLPNPGTEPASLTSPALAGRFFTTSAPWEAPFL